MTGDQIVPDVADRTQIARMLIEGALACATPEALHSYISEMRSRDNHPADIADKLRIAERSIDFGEIYEEHPTR